MSLISSDLESKIILTSIELGFLFCKGFKDDMEDAIFFLAVKISEYIKSKPLT